MSATQPASGAHTQRHSLSPCPPPALRHPYVAIPPSRRAPGRRSHAVLLCVPAPRIAAVRRNPPFPRPALTNHFASAGVSNWGDRREIDIYIYIYMFMCFCPRGVFLTLGAAAPGNLRREWPWVGFCPWVCFSPWGPPPPVTCGRSGPGFLPPLPPPQRLHPGGVTYGKAGVYEGWLEK